MSTERSAAPVRVARIDTAAIAANVRELRARAGTRDFMAVVKADGYGHGMLIAARAALDGGATWLGVADAEEALALRRAGITAPVLAWLLHTDADFGPVAEAGIDIGVSSREQLLRVAATARGAAVQIKVDTGLSRNGVAPELLDRALETASQLERAGDLRVHGVFSHLANTSPESDAAAEEALARAVASARAHGLVPAVTHLSSTAAATARDQSAWTMVRCGIGIYGVSPSDDVDPAELGLTPAMTLETEVAAVRRIGPGTGVSYDHTWRADAPTTLALVPVGYADGIPRAASNRAEVLLGGVRRPVRGRIAMDQFLVDVGDDTVRVGDRVVVFGDPATGAPSAAEWAGWAGTIGYEIVTRIGPRVERRAEVTVRLEVPDPEAMRALGRRLGGALVAGDLVVLTGPLGAGKTTLTGGIGEGLGVRGPISSPTFVLARTHPSLTDGPPLVHVDAYRLSSAAELDDLDLDVERSVTVVEWGEGLVDGLSDSVLAIRITRAPDDSRTLDLDGASWRGGLPLPG